MSADAALSLDLPAQPISLLHKIDPTSMTFVHRGQTHAQLVHALYTSIYQPCSLSLRFLLLASEIEVILTLLLCVYIVTKKKRPFGNLWLLKKRESPYGTFYIANAIFTLVLSVAIYLIVWCGFALLVSAFSFLGHSSYSWWWANPLPWWPLIIGVYVSIHGFVLGCSPRSPLSINRPTPSFANHWYYLPVPRSATIVNLTLIVPCALYTVTAFTLTAMAGSAYFQANQLSSRLLPADLAQQVHSYARNQAIIIENGQRPASDEHIWIARRVSAAYFETQRYVSIGCISAASCAFAILGICLLYGLPNCRSLVEHALSYYDEALPALCTSCPARLRFLLTKAKPSPDAGKNGSGLNINTWKMTMLALVYMGILVISAPSFGLVPLTMVVWSWKVGIPKGNIADPISFGMITVSIVSLLTCTMAAIFCSVATLDPLFRAAIGLNMIRNQIPIDIEVVQHKSVLQEDGESSPTVLLKEQDATYLQSFHGGGYRSLSMKPSTDTISGAKILDSSDKDLP